MELEKIEKIYSRFSHVYDYIFKMIFLEGRKIGIKLLDIAHEDKILEVGIGTGLSLPYYPSHCDITGIDLCKDMLVKAKKRLGRLGMNNVKLLHSDASYTEFEDNTFDRIFAAYFISVVPDPVKVIKEMKRVCKKNGKIVFVNHFKSENPIISKFEEFVSPLCCKIGFKTDVSMTNLFAEADLTICEERGVNLFDYWKVVLCNNIQK
ncbi:MAG: methyltransferase domain-containing protein [Thermodesulfobacteriota bacterium]|nr:methyltransferase domain-containing protein [Thermodesulfobacteriota bacterium]